MFRVSRYEKLSWYTLNNSFRELNNLLLVVGGSILRLMLTEKQRR